MIGALLYLPFGKFFHIFQRPAQLGVKLYKSAGASGAAAVCKRCGQPFASEMHVQDLERVLPELGFDYRIDGPAGTWQRLCPACKRISLASAQLNLVRRSLVSMTPTAPNAQNHAAIAPENVALVRRRDPEPQ